MLSLIGNIIANQPSALHDLHSRGCEERRLDPTNTPTFPADARLTVWLTESGIEGFQKYSDHNDTKYEHNHVLRDCLSDPYGDAIRASRSDIAIPNEALSYTYTIPATYGKNKWAVNPEQMAVVAFVTDKSGEVLQVVDAPVVK